MLMCNYKYTNFIGIFVCVALFFCFVLLSVLCMSRFIISFFIFFYFCCSFLVFIFSVSTVSMLMYCLHCQSTESIGFQTTTEETKRERKREKTTKIKENNVIQRIQTHGYFRYMHSTHIVCMAFYVFFA